MKKVGIIVAAVLFVLVTGVNRLNGQTVAIGHVCAEVVESVSAASATISDFELVKSSDMATSADLSAETLNLGAITINTGKNIACNVVLTPASVSNNQGDAFTIEPAVQNTSVTDSSKATGIQTLQLEASANLGNNQASGQYAGSYTVIFAYN